LSLWGMMPRTASLYKKRAPYNRSYLSLKLKRDSVSPIQNERWQEFRQEPIAEIRAQEEKYKKVANSRETLDFSGDGDDDEDKDKENSWANRVRYFFGLEQKNINNNTQQDKWNTE